MNCTHTQTVRLHIAELTELSSYLSRAETDNLPEIALMRLDDIEGELATLEAALVQARKSLVDEINSKPPVNEEIVNCRYCKLPIAVGKGVYLEKDFDKGLMGWFHSPICVWQIKEQWGDYKASTSSPEITSPVTPAPKKEDLPYEVTGWNNGEAKEHGRGKRKKDALALVARFLSSNQHCSYVEISYINQAGNRVTEDCFRANNERGFTRRKIVHYSK